MGSHVERETLHGVVVMDPRFTTETLSTTHSSYTEAGPKPGQPVPVDQVGYAQFEAMGRLSQNTQAELRIQKEGSAVGSAAGGRYVQRVNGGEWSGHLNHNKIDGFEVVDFDAKLFFPDARALQSGAMLAVAEERATIGNYRVVAYRRDPGVSGPGGWSAQIEVAAGFDHTLLCPALLQLPSGRVLCFYMDQITEVAGTLWVLNSVYSDDDGDTWHKAGEGLDGFREDTSTFTVSRLRGVYHQGYITLVLSSGGTTRHLVSADMGASFREVEDLASAQLGDPVVDSVGRVWMVYRDTNTVRYTRKGTPFSKFSDDSVHGTQLGAYTCDGLGWALTAVLDATGYLWVFIRAQASGAITRGTVWGGRFRLSDLQEVRDLWNSDGIGGVYHPIDTGDNDFYLDEFNAVAHEGSLWLVTNWTLPGTTRGEGSLHAVRLGGWSSIDWARQTFGYKSGAPPYASGHIWFGSVEASSVTGITTTSSGTFHELAGSEGSFYRTIGGQLFHTRVGLANGYVGLHRWANRLASAATTAVNRVGIESTWGDGTNRTAVELRMSSTGVQLYDIVAGAVVNDVAGNAVHSLDLSVMTSWLLYHHGQNLLLAYRQPGTAGYVVAYVSTSLTLGASVTTSMFSWGHINAGSSESSYWLWVGNAMDGCPYDPGFTAVSYPEDLEGREMSLYPQWLQDGLLLRAKGSSAHIGDAYLVPTDHEGSIQHLDLMRYPDGSMSWASESDQVEQIIAWEPEGGADTRLLSPSIGVWLDCNFREFYFEAWDGSSWVVLAHVDKSAGLSPPSSPTCWEVVGNWLRAPSGAGQGSQFASMDEQLLVALEVSGVAHAFEPARVKPGVFGASEPAMQLLLEDNAAGDLLTVATAAAVDRGACQIYPRQSLTIIHNVTTPYQAFRLRVPAQATPDGRHMAPRLHIGEFIPAGIAWDWRRRHKKSLNRQTITQRSGARTHIKRGPTRRVVEVGWPGGWDGTQIQGQGPSPDYLAPYAGVEAFGATRDFTMVEQLLERTQGGVLPVVYVATVPPASSSAVEAHTLTSMHLHMLASVSDALNRQVTLGKEWESELVSIDALVLTEEV